MQVRKKHSSNRDVRGKFHKVNLGGDEAESILKNSAKLAEIIEDSECSSTEDVVREMEKEVRGDEWERDKRGFEQHMLEEDRIRAVWKKGEFEKIAACQNVG